MWLLFGFYACSILVLVGFGVDSMWFLFGFYVGFISVRFGFGLASIRFFLLGLCGVYLGLYFGFC